MLVRRPECLFLGGHSILYRAHLEPILLEVFLSTTPSVTRVDRGIVVHRYIITLAVDCVAFVLHLAVETKGFRLLEVLHAFGTLDML